MTGIERQREPRTRRRLPGRCRYVIVLWGAGVGGTSFVRYGRDGHNCGGGESSQAGSGDDVARGRNFFRIELAPCCEVLVQRVAGFVEGLFCRGAGGGVAGLYEKLFAGEIAIDRAHARRSENALHDGERFFVESLKSASGFFGGFTDWRRLNSRSGSVVLVGRRRRRCGGSGKLRGFRVFFFVLVVFRGGFVFRNRAESLEAVGDGVAQVGNFAESFRAGREP